MNIKPWFEHLVPWSYRLSLGLSHPSWTTGIVSTRNGHCICWHDPCPMHVIEFQYDLTYKIVVLECHDDVTPIQLWGPFWHMTMGSGGQSFSNSLTAWAEGGVCWGDQKMERLAILRHSFFSYWSVWEFPLTYCCESISGLESGRPSVCEQGSLWLLNAKY